MELGEREKKPHSCKGYLLFLPFGGPGLPFVIIRKFSFGTFLYLILCFKSSGVVKKKKKSIMAFNHDADTAVSAVSAELFHWSVLWSVLCSPLLSPKRKKIKMAFAGILTDADITAALAACKGRTPPHHRETLTAHLSAHPPIAWMSCWLSRVDWHPFFAFLVVTIKTNVKLKMCIWHTLEMFSCAAATQVFAHLNHCDYRCVLPAIFH